MSLLILLAFDLVLAAAALAAYLARPRIGGQLAKGLKPVLIGVLVLGLAHGIETLWLALFELDLVVNQVMHRLLATVAYGFIILGFVLMRRAFEE